MWFVGDVEPRGLTPPTFGAAQSPTTTPMLRQVPAIMDMAASTLVQLRSGIFCSAILRRSSLLMVATLSRWGTPEALSMPQAFSVSYTHLTLPTNSLV